VVRLAIPVKRMPTDKTASVANLLILRLNNARITTKFQLNPS
jgi:hypothetical protein